MGKMKEKPRYNVVSLRLTDEEQEALEQITRLNRMSISTFMREAMLLFAQQIDGAAKH